MTFRSALLILAPIATGLTQAAVAQDEAKELRIGEEPVIAEEPAKKEIEVDKVKIRRTTAFDESEIKRLYKETKAQNEKLSEGLPAHLNPDEMDVVTLKTLNVGGDDLQLNRELIDVLDPKPRRRLARIADLDPDAAHEMMVTMRNDQEFMSGRYDRASSSGDPGRQANFTGAQLGKALENTLKALQKATGGKTKEEKAEAAEVK